MSNRHIALEFLKRFSAGDIDAATQLVVEGLHFTGPREQNSVGAPDSNDSGAPAEPCTPRVINVIEDENGDVTVLYDYERANSTLTIAQWFSFQNQRIVETDLVFGPKSSRRNWSALFLRGVRCGVCSPRSRYGAEDRAGVRAAQGAAVRANQ